MRAVLKYKTFVIPPQLSQSLQVCQTAYTLSQNFRHFACGIQCGHRYDTLCSDDDVDHLLWRCCLLVPGLPCCDSFGNFFTGSSSSLLSVACSSSSDTPPSAYRGLLFPCSLPEARRPCDCVHIPLSIRYSLWLNATGCKHSLAVMLHIKVSWRS